eukprot:7146405-Pyramimonas_sp.AAC.2
MSVPSPKTRLFTDNLLRLVLTTGIYDWFLRRVYTASPLAIGGIGCLRTTRVGVEPWVRCAEEVRKEPPHSVLRTRTVAFVSVTHAQHAVL